MRLLLDTHIFLWFITGDARLPASWRDAIGAPGNESFLSVFSLWEAVIKHAIGKLSLPHPAASYLSAQRARHEIASLPLDEASLAHLSNLTLVHRDPFDRVLVCQALEHGLTIVTVDDAFGNYPAPVLERS